MSTIENSSTPQKHEVQFLLSHESDILIEGSSDLYMDKCELLDGDCIEADTMKLNYLPNSNNLGDTDLPLLYASSYLINDEHNEEEKKNLCQTNIVDQTRKLIRKYDMCKSQSLKNHEEYKHVKWGEDEFSQIDLNCDNINFDLSIGAYINVLHLTDKFSECVKKNRSLNSVRDNIKQKLECNESVDILQINKIFNSDSDYKSHTSCTEDFNSTPVDPYILADNVIQKPNCFQPGEVAVPRRVQDILDFGVAMSQLASKMFGVFALPSCQRRRSFSVSIVDESESQKIKNKTICTYKMICHRRNHDALNNNINSQSIYRKISITTCPRRHRNKNLATDKIPYRVENDNSELTTTNTLEESFIT